MSHFPTVVEIFPAPELTADEAVISDRQNYSDLDLGSLDCVEARKAEMPESTEEAPETRLQTGGGGFGRLTVRALVHTAMTGEVTIASDVLAKIESNPKDATNVEPIELCTHTCTCRRHEFDELMLGAIADPSDFVRGRVERWTDIHAEASGLSSEEIAYAAKEISAAAISGLARLREVGSIPAEELLSRFDALLNGVGRVVRVQGSPQATSHVVAHSPTQALDKRKFPEEIYQETLGGLIVALGQLALPSQERALNVAGTLLNAAVTAEALAHLHPGNFHFYETWERTSDGELVLARLSGV